MIITEFVDVKSNKTKTFYIEKGYVLGGDKIFKHVKISDLHKGSEIRVLCKCDICGNEKTIPYVKYLKNVNNGGFYACSSKCSTVKKEKTLIKNYGENVTNPLKSDLIKNKVFRNVIDKKKKRYRDVDFLEILPNYNYRIKCDRGEKHDFIINRYLLYERKMKNFTLCTVCDNPKDINKSSYEFDVATFIERNDVRFLRGDRRFGFEMDIFLPDYNIALEINGLYHHSELFKDTKYHLDKSLKCLEEGIQLLHIWEDEYLFKRDIVKSIILNRLGKIENKIYARQCEIKVVDDSKLVKEFLDNNHIQGYCQNSIKLGLFYNTELVSLMTFGKRMIKKNVEFELLRFCNKINLNIIGGASKLFNYFKSNYQFDELISYSDFRLFDGKMYETLGFVKQHLSDPEYYWCKNLERYHRSTFMKHKLVKEGFNKNKTEVEIMHERGYYRVFGCGEYRWEYKKRP
jgi:hypothetical protein